MLDFLMISTRNSKKGQVEIYPNFKVGKRSDLMIRGGDFYAVWVEDQRLWSTDEDDLIRLVDRELDDFKESHAEMFDGQVQVNVLHMWNSETGMIDRWHKYCQNQLRDSYHMLDETLIFSNTETKKEDYASKRLPYPLEKCDTPAWDKLISTLYAPEERHKIEWAIGAIVTGDSKTIQKFMVFYGSAGTGKSTILNIIQMLFEGYYSVFDAKALGSSTNSFALEAFKTNPLVAIQHDGDLSRIEDNTRLNSLVSHEIMTVNEKYRSSYSNRFKCFLFMGTNRPVKITDAKSGLIRRLIDVSPSGNKLPSAEYIAAMNSVKFELGGIAYHCKEVYSEDPHFYDDYVPTSMMGASNDFYNYVLDYYFKFKQDDCCTLNAAWDMYKTYCEDAKVGYMYPRRAFKEELKNYFREFKERYILDDGTRVRNYYSGFVTEKFEGGNEKTESEPEPWLVFKEQESLFDKMGANYPAQYANENGTPIEKWENVTTTLSNLDTSKLHYVQTPSEQIVIDFDIPDENGNKSFEKNYAEALKWPATYAELSKSGEGIHLHYIYTGDPDDLSRLVKEHVEVKVQVGNSSLRRKLTKCNDIPLAVVSSGLPLKGAKKVVNTETIKNERHLRACIKKALNNEVHANTKPNVDYISMVLTKAYESGITYDVSDLYSTVLAYGAGSTHQAKECLRLINKMPFKSEDLSWSEDTGPVDTEKPLVFFDIECFPNLLLVNYKLAGPDANVARMFNPSSEELRRLCQFNLVGFNCRRYDNHIIYARMALDYNNEQLYKLSKRIIESGTGFFGAAYNLSYCDIYDFSTKKQSLKKFEIELGIHHQELGLSWDEPVPEELWPKVAEYCDNDVIATEAVFYSPDRQADFKAREMLADIAGMTVNDTTNSLTQRIIFGDNRNPQDQFSYRNMGDLSDASMKVMPALDCDWDYTVFDSKGRPLFPGYKFDFGNKIFDEEKQPELFKEYKNSKISWYRGKVIGEGGNVYSEPGMYVDVALLDIASMHPSSVVAEELFGEFYTKNFKELLEARIAIKHKEFDRAKTLMGGKLAKYLDDPAQAKALSKALKIPINSVYGLTAAGFDNAFRDPRNVDNIVAKRGALFMENLKHEVQSRGFTVAHIKTDSIKIPNATPEIIKFVMDYGKLYGYTFEHEATYERMCLVNDAVYIAKFATEDFCIARYGYAPEENQEDGGKWTATGTQFKVPYVFKTLFSKEPIEFSDLCETKSVKTNIYLDLNEGLPDVSFYEELKNIRAKPFDKRKKSEQRLVDDNVSLSDEDLEKEIAKGHNYRFVGKVGLFCPIKPGRGGGLLKREQNGKFYFVTDTSEHRWLESEMVRDSGMEDAIDRSYYNGLVDAAVHDISQYGDFEWFTSDDDESEPVIPFTAAEDPYDVPWDEDVNQFAVR